MQASEWVPVTLESFISVSEHLGALPAHRKDFGSIRGCAKFSLTAFSVCIRDEFSETHVVPTTAPETE